MPLKLRRTVVGLIAFGILSLALALSQIATGPAPEAWLVLVVIGMLAAGDVPLVHVRFGGDRTSFTCSEAAMIAGLIILPAPWLPVVAATGALLLHGGMRRPPVKVAYNVATFATCGLLVWGTFAILAPGETARDLSAPRTWIAFGVAGMVAASWTALTVTLAVAFSQGIAVPRVFGEAYGVRILVSLANIATTLTIAFTVSRNPWASVAVPAVSFILLMAYRNYMNALQERDSWKAVQSAARAFTSIDEAAVAAAVVTRAMSLFRADEVELLISDGADGVVTVLKAGPGGTSQVEATADPFWPRAWSEREPFQVLTTGAPATQRSALESQGLGACTVAPLVAGQACVGMLRLGFVRAGGLSKGELQMFCTYADVVSAALRNAQLFAQVSGEKQKLDRIVDSASDGIFSVDAAGVITSWNPAMTTITGTPAPTALGTTCRLARGDNRSDLVLDGDWIHGVLDGRTHAETSVSIVRDGTSRWLSLTLSSVGASTSEPVSTVVVVRDVTAAREAEQAKQDFLATVSHELRTPITSLKGWVSTLLRPEYTPSEEERTDVHRRLLHQTARLQRLIEDLLSVSSLEHGEFAVETMPVSLDELVDKTLLDFRMHAGRRPVEHVRAGLGSLAIGDPGRIEQVVANLVSNADKYSPAGLPITVTVQREGPDVTVSVRDHGPGIAEEHRSAVFERFTRLDNAQSKQAGGTGLGLHIARRLVDAMGGRIWVETPDGGGADFVFTLPAASLVAPVDRHRDVRLVG